MKLAANELCWIHRRRDCCGRKERKSLVAVPTGGHRVYSSFEPGVKRIPDEHHPRGYRERRSPSAMRRLVKRKVAEQHNCCGICRKPFTDVRDVTHDHIDPRGNGGCWRDDHPDNIQAAHSLCNMEKGSKRL